MQEGVLATRESAVLSHQLSHQHARIDAPHQDRAEGRDVTYSPKVFLPVTNLCRDRCTYCTFRKDPWDPDAWTMMPHEITDWSRRGHALGCKEALMCLGAKLEEAGQLKIPFTTGILLGIGETIAERAHSLIAIRDVHRRHGHVQEVIIQN